MTKDFSIQIPKLSPRLRMVAELAPACERIIDIGTDHAFVPIYLIAKDRCETAIASDINKGPAIIAKRNIDQYQMEDRISVVIGDGLGQIVPTPRDCVVIAGMGGYEIQSILSRSPVLAKAIILQPQKSYKELRLFLAKEGYAIIKEEIAKEQDRYYLGMSVAYTGVSYGLTNMELEIGPGILKDRPKYFIEFINQRMRKIKKQILGDPSLALVLKELEQIMKDNKEPGRNPNECFEEDSEENFEEDSEENTVDESLVC